MKKAVPGDEVISFEKPAFDGMDFNCFYNGFLKNGFPVDIGSLRKSGFFFTDYQNSAFRGKKASEKQNAHKSSRRNCRNGQRKVLCVDEKEDDACEKNGNPN